MIVAGILIGVFTSMVVFAAGALMFHAYMRPESSPAPRFVAAFQRPKEKKKPVVNDDAAVLRREQEKK